MSLLSNLQNQATQFNKEIYNPNQQSILKILAYFLGFAVIKDILTWRKPCYKECAKKCEIGGGKNVRK